MELPRGTTIKYQEEEDYDVDEVLEDIDGRFLGYIRIFGKTDSNTEDNYLLIEKGKIIAAESESDTKSIRGNESLNRMKEMKYKHAAIEFVAYEEEFKYEMALELNGHCQLDGEKVKRKKDISEKKLDREELLKKYRIRDPSDETVIELIGGRGEELLEFENRMKSKVLNNVQDFLCAKTLFMEISLTGFEAFLRGGILNSNIGVFARCIVYREAPEKARDRLNVGIKKAIKKSFDEEIGDNYKLNVNLNNKLRIREAMTGSSEEEREAETREYSIKSTL